MRGDQMTRLGSAVFGAGLLLIASSQAFAAPSVSGASGTFSHKGAVTISGSGFGTKSTAAPVVWDDASGSSITAKWNMVWPNNNPTYNTNYRSPMRNIPLPHNNITRYIAGAHGEDKGANAGSFVALWKTRTISSFPAYTYASWYQRCDDAWTFYDDNNFKVFDYSTGTGGQEMPTNWYIEYNARPTSRTSSASWHILDDALSTSEQSLDGPTSNWWEGGAVNCMSGQWTKIELEIKYTNASDGYIKLWENGKQKISYSGHTDLYPGKTRAESIGSYARAKPFPTNWRYFADVYLDYTPARVVLADNANLTNATVIETQIPTAWSGSSITLSVNAGKFTKGQTAYLFVVDSTGAHNASGYPVTVGGGATSTAPNPPTEVRVQ
jgi:hypothetical protein